MHCTVILQTGGVEHGKVLSGSDWALFPQGIKLNLKLIAVEGGKV